MKPAKRQVAHDLLDCYPSVHVYKMRLISKFCNVFLIVQVLLDVDKGTILTLKFLWVRKREGIPAVKVTRWNYVIVLFYILCSTELEPWEQIESANVRQPFLTALNI